MPCWRVINPRKNQQEINKHDIQQLLKVFFWIPSWNSKDPSTQKKHQEICNHAKFRPPPQRPWHATSVLVTTGNDGLPVTHESKANFHELIKAIHGYGSEIWPNQRHCWFFCHLSPQFQSNKTPQGLLFFGVILLVSTNQVHILFPWISMWYICCEKETIEMWFPRKQSWPNRCTNIILIGDQIKISTW